MIPDAFMKGESKEISDLEVWSRVDAIYCMAARYVSIWFARPPPVMMGYFVKINRW